MVDEEGGKGGSKQGGRALRGEGLFFKISKFQNFQLEMIISSQPLAKKMSDRCFPNALKPQKRPPDGF